MITELVRRFLVENDDSEEKEDAGYSFKARLKSEMFYQYEELHKEVMIEASEDDDEGQDSEEKDENTDLKVREVDKKGGSRGDRVSLRLDRSDQVVPPLVKGGDIFSGSDIYLDAVKSGDPFWDISGDCLGSKDTLKLFFWI